MPILEIPGLIPIPSFHNGAGTLLQSRAWAHANTIVVEKISLINTISDYRQKFLELKCEDRLSVADAVVLQHRLGVTKAAHFVAQVDPWCYLHDGTPATIWY